MVVSITGNGIVESTTESERYVSFLLFVQCLLLRFAHESSRFPSLAVSLGRRTGIQGRVGSWKGSWVWSRTSI
jgi:hypothetical protein